MRQLAGIPLGMVEPHAALLRQLPSKQTVYKIMNAENFIRSVAHSYLHFNRVDSYKDFTGADSHDGAELPTDQCANQNTRFEKAPDFTASDYYRQSRLRTYACCFSTENSDFIWQNYGNGGTRGKIGILFDFDRLRATLNRTVQEAIDNDLLLYKEMPCYQIFSINYGLIDYIDRESHQENAEHLPNPIRYTYLKDDGHAEEKELRISLSALGIGHFALKDGTLMAFPESFQLQFNYRVALMAGVITGLEDSPDCDRVWVQEELHKLGINVPCLNNSSI